MTRGLQTGYCAILCHTGKGARFQRRECLHWLRRRVLPFSCWSLLLYCALMMPWLGDITNARSTHAMTPCIKNVATLACWTSAPGAQLRLLCRWRGQTSSLTCQSSSTKSQPA